MLTAGRRSNLHVDYAFFFFLQKWNTDYLKGNYFLNDAHYMHLIVFIAS